MDQIVIHHNRVSSLVQELADMGADVAGAACHENGHTEIPQLTAKTQRNVQHTESGT